MNKDPATPFFFRAEKKILMGQDIYIVDSEPWVLEGAFFWFFILPFMCVKIYVKALFVEPSMHFVASRQDCEFYSQSYCRLLNGIIL